MKVYGNRAIVLLLCLLLFTSIGVQSAAAQDDTPRLCGVEVDEAESELTSQIAEGLWVRGLDGEDVELRFGPSPSSRIVATVHNGIPMEVIGGPTELSGNTWWEVVAPDGSEGWVLEADGQENLLAVGTEITEDLIAFNDGVCAAHPEGVASVRFIPRGFNMTVAWGLYFNLPVELSEGELYFLDNEVPLTNSKWVNITTEPDGETKLVRILVGWFVDFGTIDLRTHQFWFLWEDGE